MLEILISIPIVWVIGLLFGYCLHRFLHSSKSGWLGRSHMAHHTLYTISDFTSTSYRGAGVNNGTIIFLIASLPLAAVPILLYIVGIFPIYLTASILLEMALIGYLNVYVHDQFHVRNNLLLKVKNKKFAKFYRRLIKMHFLHHKYVKTNFGVFSFEFDKMFGTYKKIISSQI